MLLKGYVERETFKIFNNLKNAFIDWVLNNYVKSSLPLCQSTCHESKSSCAPDAEVKRITVPC